MKGMVCPVRADKFNRSLENLTSCSKCESVLHLVCSDVQKGFASYGELECGYHGLKRRSTVNGSEMETIIRKPARKVPQKSGVTKVESEQTMHLLDAVG